MGNAERAERVDDGVHDRGEGANIAGLAGPLDTQRVGLGRHRVLVHLEGRDLVGTRQTVIHQGAREQLARAPVIHQMLSEGLADPLHHPTMDLAFKRKLVDDGADIVDDDIAQHFGSAGLGIDLDLADVAAVWKVRDLGRKTCDLVEPGFEPFGDPRRHIGGRGHILQSHHAVGANHAKGPVGEFDVVLGRFQCVRCDPIRLGDYLVGRDRRGAAAEHRGARGIGAAAVGRQIGVGVRHANVGLVEPELMA